MFDNQITVSDIVVYSFIGIFVLIIIFALIYNKWIKPIKISYTNSSLKIKNQLQNNFNNLLKNQVINNFVTNISFKVNNIDAQAVSKIIFGKKLVYFISNPVSKNVTEVVKIQKEFKMITLKSSSQYLAPEINLFISGAKYLKAVYCPKAIIIVLFENKQFVDTQIDHIYFLNLNNLQSFIKNQEKLINEEIDFHEIRDLNKIIVNKKWKFFR